MLRSALILFSTLALVYPAGAQVETTASLDLTQPDLISQTTSASELLERRAYLSVEDVSLDEGLHALREASGVPLAFSPSRVEGNGTVTCRCDDATVRTALDRLLAGTDFEFVPLDGRIIIERSARERADPGGVSVADRLLEDLRNPVATTKLRLVARSPQQVDRTGTVAGQVVSLETGRPLAAAQVEAVGTGLGAITDAAGQYSIASVPAGEVQIRVQTIGHATQSRTVQVVAGETVQVDFELRQEAIGLDAIVVTGQAGATRRREVGVSIGGLSASDIDLAPVSGTQEMLAGRVPGATVMANTGQPGRGGTMVLRGLNSLTQGNSPLIYVDGVRMFSEGAAGGLMPFNDINPGDIDRIEVVRGPAATTIYGTEASAGVIQIFTKRGTDGRAVWEAETQFGVNHWNPATSQDPSGFFLAECTGPNLVTSQGVQFEDVTCPSSGSWLELGQVQRHFLSVRGGSADPSFQYYLSGNFNREGGVIAPGSSNDRGVRANFDFAPADNLTFGARVMYNQRESQFLPDGNNFRGFLLNVTRGPANNYKIGADPANDLIREQELTNEHDHYVLGFSIDHTPSDRFNQQLRIGYDYNAIVNENHRPFGHPTDVAGFISVQEWKHYVLSFDYSGSFRNQLGDNVTSRFSWGGQLFEDTRRQLNVTGNEFAGPGQPTVTSASRTSTTADIRLRVINAGVFIEEQVGLFDRLYITAGARFDGNSAFGDDFGIQMYPKLNASYIVSDHDFWPFEWAEPVQLRAAVGDAGRAPGAFDAVQTWNPISGDDGSPAFTPGQLGNPELGPERSREYEVGMDATFLEGRLGVDMSFFHQTTNDALIGMTPPASLGFLSSQLENVGVIRSTGMELELTGVLLQSDQLDWRGRFHLATSNSEAVDVAGQEIILGSGRWNNFIREGYPVPSLFGTRVVNAGEMAEPVLEENQFVGPVYPTRTIGMGTTLTALSGQVTLDVHGEFQGGHYLQNAVGFQNSLRNVWVPCYEAQRAAADGDPAALNSIPAEDRYKCLSPDEPYSHPGWLESADFFKLRSASLNLQLPERWIPGAETARLTLSGRNLFTITDYTGLDPEVTDFGFSVQRQEYYNIPPTRRFLASLRVTF